MYSPKLERISYFFMFKSISLNKPNEKIYIMAYKDNLQLN